METSPPRQDRPRCVKIEGVPPADRLIFRGIRYSDHEFPVIAPIKDKVRLLLKPLSNYKNYWSPSQISLGPNVEGFARPHVCTNDAETVLAGALKRVLTRTPEPSSDFLRRVNQFTREFCRKNFKKIDLNTDMSVETWLSKTNYPDWRKKELLEAWNSRGPTFSSKDRRVKYFVKDETYESKDKFARIINARGDRMKCFFGPIFKAIEDIVYKHKAFIKHVPVDQRPKYVMEQVYKLGSKYCSGDFTSFESHFTRLIMESIEYELYDYMTEDIPERDEFLKIFKEVILGTNHCFGKFFDYFVEATRMSGEMNTSLGNGFANLILILFIFGEDVRCVVEGDDSLVAFEGQAPSPELFRQYGWTVKMEIYEQINEASFCGLVFDPEVLCNITDPIKVLASFGIAGAGYVRYGKSKLRALLRCKALSYAFQYSGCPIIQSLAHYALRMTKSVDVRHFVTNDRHLSDWDRQLYRDSLLKLRLSPPPVQISSRLLMEKKFGISPEFQIRVEEYLNSLSSLCELAGPVKELMMLFSPDDYAYYYHNYKQVITDPLELQNDSFARPVLFHLPVWRQPDGPDYGRHR
jgi:hypothetical protein